MKIFTNYKKLGLLILFGISILMTITNCEDDINYTDTKLDGEVIDYSFKKCACCQGWRVAIAMDTLRFKTVPENEQLNDLVNFYGFPIPIKFRYKDTEGSCNSSYKEMTTIEFEIDEDCGIPGEIISYNSTECACCPGWIIKTEEETIKVERLPIERKVREIVNEYGYPIKVKLEYTDLTGSCSDIYKKVTCFSLDED